MYRTTRPWGANLFLKGKKVVIVGGVRIPFVKSFTKYKNASNKDMLTHVLQALVKKYKLQGKKVDVSGFKGAAEARKEFKKSVEAYQNL